MILKKLSDFSYNLPKSFIAQEPLKERQNCKMLFFNRKNNKIEHLIFSDITDILSPSCLLILNKTKVFPARLITNDGIDILLVKEKEKNIWEILAKPRKRIKEGLGLDFGSLKGEIISCHPVTIRFNCNGNLFDILDKEGSAPLPPYIKRSPIEEDKTYYQTVYAQDTGSIAAPTAGLHWTPDILLKLKERGIPISYITLHIGIGTFKPIRCEDIKEHKMDEEYVEIEESIDTGKRLIACGTSVVRAIESVRVRSQESGVRSRESGVGSQESEVRSRESGVWSQGSIKNLKLKTQNSKLCFWTDIFIYPGWEFKYVNGLITNFHLPESPPFIMTSAFVGLDKLKEIYEEAKSKNYRFASYGDCMIVL